MRIEEEEEDHDPTNETAAVWKHVKGPACTIFLTFFVTLSLFPGWTSELRSVHQCKSEFRIFNDLYTPYSFLLFNVGDLVGRLLCAKIPIKKITSLSTKLVVASGLRFVFFPLLFLCVGGSDPDRWQIPSDLYSQFIQFAFAVSNGLLLSMSFVLAPTLIPSSIEMQERSSEFLSFAVAFGLLCGSLFSFPIAKLVSI
jgi:equilibrative nucleoside transporter 1/2/3